MPTWFSVSNPTGRYTSTDFNINGDFDYYITEYNLDYDIPTDSGLKVQASISLDSGFSWSEWKTISNTSSDIFDNVNSVSSALIKYRVVMTSLSISDTPTHKLTEMNFKGSIVIENKGDLVCKPEIWIKKINNNGDIKLKNETNNQLLKLNNLTVGETVYIDCENEDIVTDLSNTYRYDDFNDEYLEFELGENLITGEGEFEVDFRYEFKLLQG